jgi:hypothetical protein
MSSKSAPTNPPQYSIDTLLFDLEWKATFENMTQADRTKFKAELNQLIYTQVLELIGEDDAIDYDSYDYDADLDMEEKRHDLRNKLRAELRAKAKAKYIGGDSE